MNVFAEVENNDSFQRANTGNVNSTIYGALSDYNDKDYFKINVLSKGYIRFEMNRIPGSSHDVYLYDGSYKELWGAYAYDEGTMKSPDIGVSAGTYYIRIEGNNYSNYNFQLKYTQATNWESEFNEDFEQTNTAGTNTSVYGSLREYNDKDYFKINVPSKGYIRFEMNRISGSSHDVYLYDGSYKELWNGYAYDEGTIKSPDIGVSAGTYYIRIEGSNYSNYNFQLKHTQATNWETEFNESFEQTNTADINTSVYGSLREYNDKDYFKINVPSKGYIRFEMNRISGSSHDVYLYDGSYKELWNGYAYDEGTIKSSDIGVSAGTYYVRIEGNNYSNYSFKLIYLDHIHSYVIVKGYSATTTSTGLTDGKKCSICGYWLTKQQVTPKLSPQKEVSPKEETPNVIKYTQSISVHSKKCSVNSSKVKKKKQIIKKNKAFVIRNAKGKLTFKRKSGSKRLTISKGGAITVKKGTKKGTYRITVRITASGNSNYKAATKMVNVYVRVR